MAPSKNNNSTRMSEILRQYGLGNLAIITARLDEDDAELLKTYVLNETGINIYHVDKLETLPDESIQQLRDFENKRADILMTLHTSCMVHDLKGELAVVNNKVTNNTSKHTTYIAYILVLCTMSYVFAISFMTIPEANSKYVDFISGSLLTGILGVVLGFVFNRDNNNNPPRSARRASDFNKDPNRFKNDCGGNNERTNSHN